MKKPVFGRWMYTIFISLLFLAWAATGVMIYFRIFLLVSILLIVSYFWNLVALNGIKVSRRSRSLRTSVGKVFDERFDIINLSRWPCMWLELTNLSKIPQRSGSRLLTSIGGMQQRSYTARTWITKRGAYPLGPTLITSGDPFGLFISSRLEPASNSLIVLPLTVEIPYFPSPGGILPGGKDIHKKTMDVSPHATGVREYVPGDPIKRVHWPTTAKRDRFMVKTYEQDPQAEIWFFLDSERKVQFSLPEAENETSEEYININKRSQIKLPQNTYEYAISATASLAKYFLQHNRAVGLASSASQFTVIPSERGDRQLGKILEALAFLQPEGELPLAGVVDAHAKRMPMGSGGILVTPSLNEDIYISVEQMNRRHIHPMVVLIIPETFGGPAGSQKIIAGLQQRNVPVFKIVYGKDLDQQLGQIKDINKRTWSPV